MKRELTLELITKNATNSLNNNYNLNLGTPQGLPRTEV